MNRARAGGRRGSDWVAEAHQDEGPWRCVICGHQLLGQRTVLCGDDDCLRVYWRLHKQETRVKTKVPEFSAAWVEKARLAAGPGKCVIDGSVLPPRRAVLCGKPGCRKTYDARCRLEARAAAKTAQVPP